MVEAAAHVAPAKEAVIVAQNVAVSLGTRRVVHGVDLEARRNEVLAILGPNGAGKSTLLRAVSGLLPFTGSVQLHGQPVAQMPVRERARKLAFVPQQTSLRSALPVYEVVLQGRFAHRGAFAGATAGDRAAVEHALAVTDSAGFAKRSFTALSFGEQRRVLIARGLATGARVLCLDEPTASLDVGHALHLHALLRTLARDGYAVVLVLHALSDALQHADRALLLSAGRSVCTGPVADVITEQNVRAVYGVEMERGAGLAFSLGRD